MSRNIEHEVGILWLEEPKLFPYLREFHPSCTAKKGWRKKWGAGRRVVAVAELSAEAKTTHRRLARRAWYFDEKDPYPGRDKPSEAVIPESITAGKESVYGRRG
jgi:hypothetical protein